MLRVWSNQTHFEIAVERRGVKNLFECCSVSAATDGRQNGHLLSFSPRSPHRSNLSPEIHKSMWESGADFSRRIPTWPICADPLLVMRSARLQGKLLQSRYVISSVTFCVVSHFIRCLAMERSKGLDLYEKSAHVVCTVCFRSFCTAGLRWQQNRRKYNAPGVDNPWPEFQLAGFPGTPQEHSYREPFDWRVAFSPGLVLNGAIQCTPDGVQNVMARWCATPARLLRPFLTRQCTVSAQAAQFSAV